jgi:hypothetical protein
MKEVPLSLGTFKRLADAAQQGQSQPVSSTYMQLILIGSVLLRKQDRGPN